MVSLLTTHPLPSQVKGSTCIPGLQQAKRGFQFLTSTPALQVETKALNLSLEDWAGRFISVASVYIPQTMIALVNRAHIFETIGRNILAWSFKFGVLVGNKHPRFSLAKGVLDPLMQPKRATVRGPAWQKPIRSLVNRLRPEGDYFDILQAANIPFSSKDRHSAFWTKLDETNHWQAVTRLYQDLKQKPAAQLSKQEEHLLKLIPQFAARRSLFNFALAATIVSLATILVGRVSMDIVFKWIAPLDKDFNPAGWTNRQQLNQAKAPSPLPAPSSALTQPGQASTDANTPSSKLLIEPLPKPPVLTVTPTPSAPTPAPLLVRPTLPLDSKPSALLMPFALANSPVPKAVQVPSPSYAVNDVIRLQNLLNEGAAR